MEIVPYHEVGLLIRDRPFRDRGCALIEEMPEIKLADVAVPRIPMSRIRNGNYAAAVRESLDEKHRRHDATTDKALNAFYSEYRQMQDAGFGSLLRAGVRQGLRFVFRPSFPVSLGTVACYTWQDRAIEFQIPKYQAANPRQNVLAHELGHMILDGRNAPAAVDRSFAGSGAFGHMWYQTLEHVAVLYDNRWKNAHAETSFGTDHGQHLIRELDRVKEHYPPEIWVDEMLCRVLEIPAGDDRGVGVFPERSIERIGTTAVLLLADARASGNDHAFGAIARTWMDFNPSEPFQKAYGACLRSWVSIARDQAFSTENFVRQRQNVSQLLCALGQDGAAMLAQARQAAWKEHPALERQQKLDFALLQTLHTLAEIRTAQQKGLRPYVLRDYNGLALP